MSPAEDPPGDTDATRRVSESDRRLEPRIQEIGPYRLLEKIGEGGFGEVYAADQTKPVKRRVALKILKAGMDTKAVLARFEAERQALAMMDHPSIAKVLDAGETKRGRPYFVMDLVKGEPITKYCDRHTLSTKERLDLFISVCHAVQHAHQKGIIHRDLKPSNILVMLTDGKPLPKVIDFGIAKATTGTLTEKTLYTQQGQLIGTPEYMSPEQAEMGGLDVDTTTDVYSLGVVLYELLTGSLPFDPDVLRKRGYAEIQRILREEEPPKPSTKVSTRGAESRETAKLHRTDVRSLARQLRGELDWIVLKAMEKDRTRRYETANSLAMDVRRYLADEPVIAGPPSAAYRARKFAKRNKVAIGVIAAILVTVTGALVQSNLQRARIQAARDESEAVTEFLSEMLASVDPGEQGRDVTVKEVLDEAAKTIGEKFENQPLIDARLRQTIGTTYQSLGEYDAAEHHLTRAFETRRRMLGDDHLETLNAATHLGRVLYQRSRYEEAEALVVETLETSRQALGDEHPQTLTTQHLLAIIFFMQGRYGEAEPILRQTLDARKRVLGIEHESTLTSMTMLATTQYRQGRYDEAEVQLRQAWEIRRRLLGDEHLSTMFCQERMATVYRRQGRLDDAARLQEEVLEVTRRQLGEEHMRTLETMNNLSNVYEDQGRDQEVEALRLEVIEIARRNFGEEHDYTLSFTGNLAILYANQQRYEEAESLYRQTLETARRAFGEENGTTQNQRYNLACLMALTGRPAEAIRLLRQAVDYGYSGPWMTEDPDLASLHGDPEFEAIVAEVRRRNEESETKVAKSE